MAYASEPLIRDVRQALLEIGYPDDLLLTDYPFADVLSDSFEVRNIPFAAFAQGPPSYRSASMGIAFLRDARADDLRRFTALGAPQIFVMDAEASQVGRWKIRSAEPPELLERFAPGTLPNRIREERSRWEPAHVLRAKSAFGFTPPEQLDFYDLGLIPVLEGWVQEKLDGLLRGVIADGMKALKEGGQHQESHAVAGLYRLVFRLLAAKLLGDRGHHGSWLNEDVDEVIRRVDDFYFPKTPPTPLSGLLPRQRIWDSIRESIHLQNLSVEALAFVYENTLVSAETRAKYGTHATPHQIAEFVVNSLPFEELPPEERIVFEPFTGHAPFLTAALGRLKTLLGSSVPPSERHDYFVRMLRGLEIDPFAAEVARYSLMLADFPNPDGWQIEVGDVFDSPRFDTLLHGAQVVLSNPPYENSQAAKCAEQILTDPPSMLGLVLPRKSIDGVAFREFRRALLKRYGEVRTSVLPDVAFKHSESETLVLLAYGRGRTDRILVSQYVSREDFNGFLKGSRATWATKKVRERSGSQGLSETIWRTPRADTWERLSHYDSLNAVLEDSARGVEYRVRVRDEREALVSDEPRAGFQAGVMNVPAPFEPYLPLEPQYLRIEDEWMRGRAHRKPWAKPKVLVNANRLSRGPWTVAAALDRSGLVAYQTFLGLWPREDVPMEVVAAIMNGPVANAFLYDHRTSRHNQLGTVRKIPIPPLGALDSRRIVSLVRRYIAERRNSSSRPAGRMGGSRLIQLVNELDVELLRAYDLPPREERSLLDLFGGVSRPGVEEFSGYFPSTFRPAIPWAEYISDDFRKASAKTTLERLPKIDDPAVAEVVRRLGSLV